MLKDIQTLGVDWSYQLLEESNSIEHDASKQCLAPNDDLLANSLVEANVTKIPFVWRDSQYERQGRLLQSLYEAQGKTFYFDIVWDVFLPGEVTEFVPERDTALFTQYLDLILKIIQHLNPLVGVIDTEADLICGDLSQQEFVIGWGNYFSKAFLHGWTQSDWWSLQQAVDIYLPINKKGVLTFIHPLAANQAWTPRHELVQSLVYK